MHCCLSQLSFQASIAELLRGLLKRPSDRVFAAVVWSLTIRSSQDLGEGCGCLRCSSPGPGGIGPLGVEFGVFQIAILFPDLSDECSDEWWWIICLKPYSLVGGQISFSLRSLWEVNHGLMIDVLAHVMSDEDTSSCSGIPFPTRISCHPCKSFRFQTVCLSLITSLLLEYFLFDTKSLAWFLCCSKSPWFFYQANLAHYEKTAVNTAKMKQRRPVVLWR